MVGNTIQDKIKMFSVSHYYKLKGFDRDYIQILRLSLKKKNSERPSEPYDETRKLSPTLRDISSKSRQVARISSIKNSSIDFRIKQEKKSPI